MIHQLCMNQNAVVRVVDGESEPGVIGRGVRQGVSAVPPAVLNKCRGDNDRNTGGRK